MAYDPAEAWGCISYCTGDLAPAGARWARRRALPSTRRLPIDYGLTALV